MSSRRALSSSPARKSSILRNLLFYTLKTGLTSFCKGLELGFLPAVLLVLLLSFNFLASLLIRSWKSPSLSLRRAFLSATKIHYEAIGPCLLSASSQIWKASFFILRCFKLIANLVNQWPRFSVHWSNFESKRTRAIQAFACFFPRSIRKNVLSSKLR